MKASIYEKTTKRQERLPLFSSWDQKADEHETEVGARVVHTEKKRQTMHIYLRSLDRFLFSGVSGVLEEIKETNI